MNTCAELNIEEGMPTVSEAMYFLERGLALHKSNHHHCVLVIHGYGSSGTGGTIRKKARQWLQAQERNKKVKSVIFGEDFSMFDFKALDLKKRCRDLSQYINTYNHGVTIVEL